HPPLESGSLQLAREGRRVWPIDCGPAANIRSRVHVGMGGEPTGTTEELRLRTTVGFFTMPTGATRLAGVRRVDVDHPHAGQCGFVGNGGAKLKEAPTVQHSLLAFRTIDSATDMRQVFQRNAAPCAFRRADKRLAQTVVDILGKPFFTSTALLQESLGRLRTLLLQLRPEAAVAGAYLIDVGMFWSRRIVQELAITGRRQLDDAQINAEKIIALQWARIQAHPR